MNPIQRLWEWICFTSGNKPEATPKSPPPKKGEVWHIGQADPFGIAVSRYSMVVVDVKDGWVLYRSVDGVGRQWAMKIEAFMNCYTRSQHQPAEP